MSQDSAWKDVLEGLFPHFLEFFFPEIYQDVDFNRGFEFLDKELRQILKRSETGKRIVDKLVKIFLKNGSEKWLLLHI
ncbi:MAG: transposase, partial [candidate division KSB1 bacterium]|nr:transposase [candidate division KSB1 bacterium]